MNSTFDLIGINIRSQQAFDALVAQADARGEATRLHRQDAILHGRCWKLGAGFEVWTMLYERARNLTTDADANSNSSREISYAGCRPAFRARHVTRLAPWALTEFTEEGEAMIHAYTTERAAEVLFELQNLTEVGNAAFHERELRVALCGLAYRARICNHDYKPLAWQPLQDASCVHTASPQQIRNELHSASRTDGNTKRSGQLDATSNVISDDEFNRSPPFGAPPAPLHENDWSLRARVTAINHLSHPLSNHGLLRTRVQLARHKLEVIINPLSLYDARGEILKRELAVGDTIAADIWLQGHILDERALDNLHEGIDRTARQAEMWRKLNRRN